MNRGQGLFPIVCLLFIVLSWMPALFLTLGGCAPKFAISEKHDKFHPGVTVIDSTFMRPSVLSSVSLKPTFVYTNDTAFFTMDFFYEGEHWLFIDTVIFLIDGKPQTYKIRGTPIREVISGSLVYEFPSFPVPEQLFKDISSANSVSVRLQGAQYYYDVALSQEIIGNLNKFYEAVVQHRGNARVTSTSRPVLGVKFLTVTAPVASILKMGEPRGVIIATVDAGSPAFKAGIQKGDVILKYGDKIINATTDLQAAVANTAPAITVPLIIWRQGNEITLSVSY